MIDTSNMSVGTHACVYSKCQSSNIHRPYLSFFKFPKDEERQRIWIENSGNLNLCELGPKQILSRSICELHFPSKYITINPYRKALVNHAIPLHYIKGDTTITEANLSITREFNAPGHHFKIIVQNNSKNRNNFFNKNFTIRNIPIRTNSPRTLTSSPPDLRVLPVKKVYSNKISSKYTENSFVSSSNHSEEAIDLVTSTKSWPLEKSRESACMSHAGWILVTDAKRSSTITQSAAIHTFEDESNSHKTLECGSAEEIEHENSNLAEQAINDTSVPDIKQEIIKIDEFTNVCEENNTHVPVPMIKQETVNLPEPSMSPENRLEPMCFVSTTQSINEDVYENITDPIQVDKNPKEDQYDIFGKFVASELRCAKTEALRKKIKLTILKILMDTTE